MDNIKETLNKARLTALHVICLHISRHITQKPLDIRQYACEIFMQSDKKSDYASHAQALFSASLKSNLFIFQIETIILSGCNKK